MVVPLTCLRIAAMCTLQQVRHGLLLDAGRGLPAERDSGLGELFAHAQPLELLDVGLLRRRRLANHV